MCRVISPEYVVARASFSWVQPLSPVATPPVGWPKCSRRWVPAEKWLWLIAGSFVRCYCKSSARRTCGSNVRATGEQPRGGWKLSSARPRTVLTVTDARASARCRDKAQGRERSAKEIYRKAKRQRHPLECLCRFDITAITAGMIIYRRTQSLCSWFASPV